MAASKLLLSTPCLALSVALPLALAGCDPRDPVWDLPCDQRPAREVLVGTGVEHFVAADAGLIPIQSGDQGGQHIWVSVRLRGFGPEASLAFGILDATDPMTIYSGPNNQHVELRYNTEEEASEAPGLYGYLASGYDPDTQMELPGPAGKAILLWADVTDACTSDAVHAEATGQVQ